MCGGGKRVYFGIGNLSVVTPPNKMTVAMDCPLGRGGGL